MKTLKKIESFTSRMAMFNRKYSETEVKSPHICLFAGTNRDFANERFIIHRAYRKKTGWEISLKESGAVLDIKFSGKTRKETLEKLSEFLTPLHESDIDRLDRNAKENMEKWDILL